MRQLPLLHQGNDRFETGCESASGQFDYSSTFVKDLIQKKSQDHQINFFQKGKISIRG
jgi:hypothetical protein